MGYVKPVETIVAEIFLAYRIRTNQDVRLSDWTPWELRRPMLVLSRKKNETIIIDDQITVTIVEIRGDKVKLGIEAPSTVSVDRREVWEAKRRNQSNPASTITPDRSPI